MNDIGYWNRPPILTPVPRVWPWAFSRDQCHVSPQLWRIKRETESGWEERERDSTWHVSYVQRLDALTIGTWLTCVCATWDVYVYSWSWGWMDGVGWVWWLILIPLTGKRWGAWCLYVSGINCAKSELKGRSGIRVKLQRQYAWNSAGKGSSMSTHMLHLLLIRSVISWIIGSDIQKDIQAWKLVLVSNMLDNFGSQHPLLPDN